MDTALQTFLKTLHDLLVFSAEPDSTALIHRLIWICENFKVGFRRSPLMFSFKKSIADIPNVFKIKARRSFVYYRYLDDATRQPAFRIFHII